MDVIDTYFLDVIGLAFLVSLVFVEVSALILRKRRYAMYKAFVLTYGTAAVAAFYFWHFDTASVALKPVGFALFSVAVVAVPLAILGSIAWLVMKSRASIRQTLLLSGAAVVAVLWPFATVTVLCGSGLDCF